MRVMIRYRKLTLPDGTGEVPLDGRVIMTALPQFTTVYMDQPIMANRALYQSSTPRQFSVTFVGKIFEETNEALRAWLDAYIGEKRDPDGVLLEEGAFGLRNRRFYLYEDRFWWVRHEGTHLLFPHPGVRLEYTSMELYLRVLDPFLNDEAGNLYRCW